MSEAEQAAFFARSGSQLEKTIVDGFQTVDTRLNRIEFFHDAAKPLRSAEGYLELRSPMSPEGLGHYRVLIEVLNLNFADQVDGEHPSLYLAARDRNLTYVSGDIRQLRFGAQSIVWSVNPDEQIQNTVFSAGQSEVSQIDFGGHMYKVGPFPTLSNFDSCVVNMFVTAPLFEHLAGMAFIVNRYIVAGAPVSELVPRDFAPLKPWPEDLSDSEIAVPWVQVMLKGDDPALPPPAWPVRNWYIDYATYTPQRMDEQPTG
jgi:hypothetical protein